MSAKAIEKALTRLADPAVNSEIYLASTTTVAKDIIQSLPGVKRLRKEGPKVAQAVLPRVQVKQTQKNENFLSIALHILEAYPSDEVKFGLAKPIVDHRFTGLNSFLAAETFLKAIGIEAARADVVATALREANKIVVKDKKTVVKDKSSQQAATNIQKRGKRPARSKAK